MGRACISPILATIVLLCCFQSAFCAKLRVRKEIRNLTPREYGMYVQGLATMITVPSDVGRMLFGDKYRDMNYFLVVHACNALDPVGAAPLADIGHFGPWFMNFHKALELMYESALLSVMPALKAMPYWKMYEDMAGGKYYNTSEAIFTKKYAGSLPGDPANGYAVMDGPFAARQIGQFNYYKYSPIAPWYNGSSTGQMRGPNNLNTNPLFTRFPSSFATSEGATGPLSQGLEMEYNRSTFMRCGNPGLVKSAWDFVSCIDLPTTALSGLPNNPTWTASRSAFTHGMFHSIVGSVGPNNGAVNSTIPFAQILGDPKDLATSPNEIVLFMPHHANLDRLWMIWQASIAKIDPLQASKDVLWGFPKVATNVPPRTLNHSALHDVLSYMRPFIDILPGNPPNPLGVTNYELLTWKSDYTYDDMIPY